MERTVPLSTGFGEVMAPPPDFGPKGRLSSKGQPSADKAGGGVAPQTLVTALIVSPDGRVTLDPGALHGRSELESGLEMMQKKELVEQGASFWIVWVAVELDPAQKPLRYKGLSVCEMLVNRERRAGYKSLAEHVNRMAEALRGGTNLITLSPQDRSLVKQQLMAMSLELWERSSDSLKAALE